MFTWKLQVNAWSMKAFWWLPQYCEYSVSLLYCEPGFHIIFVVQNSFSSLLGWWVYCYNFADSRNQSIIVCMITLCKPLKVDLVETLVPKFACFFFISFFFFLLAIACKRTVLWCCRSYVIFLACFQWTNCLAGNLSWSILRLNHGKLFTVL